MKLFATALTAVLLSGCAAVVEPVSLPGGQKGFVVSCNGSADSWAKCYNAAAKACPAGYDVVNQQHASTPTQHGPMVTRDLIVSCKK